MFKAVWISLFSLCAAASAEEFRSFQNTSGQTIEARIVDYRKSADHVRLSMKNGREGKVPLTQLCAEDRDYLEAWASVRKFMDEDTLSIEISEDSTAWRDLGDGRDDKETTYTINVANRGSADFESVRVEYCLYNQREHYIGSYNRTLSWKKIPAGKQTDLEETVRRKSFRRKSDGFLNETIALRIRIYIEADNGTVFFREASFPENLPLETYPWARGDFERQQEKDRMPAPEDYPQKELTESEIRAVAEQYVEAFMNNDHAAFQDLLRPMHPGDQALDNHMFHYYHHGLSSMKIEAVSGNYVELTLRSKESGNKRSEWLMFSPSGHIKYSPYLFPHPLARCLRYNLRNLMHEETRQRKYAASVLKRASVPIFKYDPEASFGAREQEVFLILDWLKESGREYDTSEPRVAMPRQMFDEGFSMSERYIESMIEKHYR